MKDTTPDHPDVIVIASARRRTTVSARLVGGVIEVRVPARLTGQARDAAVADVVAKLRRKTASRPVSDEALTKRAKQLNTQVLDSRARLGSIRWVSNQQHRWGSCTTATGDIRISDRLQNVPDYVLDAVIVHELVHTFIADHSPEFYSWADRAPRAERARGFLEAYQRFGGEAATT